MSILDLSVLLQPEEAKEEGNVNRESSKNVVWILYIIDILYTFEFVWVL